MPTQWSGTLEERIARLTQSGRRCDGNSGYCTRAAVEIYELYRADGQGNRLSEAEQTSKKSCSYHRKQFINSGLWIVAGTKRIPNKPKYRA